MSLLRGLDDSDGEPMLPERESTPGPSYGLEWWTPHKRVWSPASPEVVPADRVAVVRGKAALAEPSATQCAATPRRRLSVGSPSAPVAEAGPSAVQAGVSAAGCAAGPLPPTAATCAGAVGPAVPGAVGVQRRVSGKSAPGTVLDASAAQLLARVRQQFVKDGPDDDGEKLWVQLREHLRQEFVKRELDNGSGGAAEVATGGYRDKRLAARSAWQRLSASKRLALLQELLSSCRVPEHLVHIARCKIVEWQQDAQEPSAQKRRLHTTSLMLTWNGPWGMLDGPSVPPSGTALDLAAEALRQHPAVGFLWQEALALMAKAKEALHLDHHAVSLEMCARTWAQQGVVRVHLHAFLVCRGGLRLRNTDSWRFGGSRPFRSNEYVCAGARGRNVRAGEHGGLYYLQAPKQGSLLQAGTLAPFTDFVVNPTWITVLWQTGKFTSAVCCEQYTLAKKDVKRNVQNVLDQEALQREQDLRRCLHAAQAQIQQQLRPRKSVPQVDEVWLREQAIVRDRQRFLVLDGPSRTGKTQFAVQLRGPEHTLEVNCAACLREPDLRGYVYGQHKAVVFDEAHCCMVIACKRLFQAPAALVQMAASNTNCFGYSVCLHGVLLIVCSNKWAKELEELAAEDRAWLELNSVYVQVREPLWVE